MSLSKSNYAFQDVQANVDNIKSIVDMERRELAYNAMKTVVLFENALKEKMLEDLKYIISVEKEVDDLEMEIDDLKSQLENAKIDFSKIDNLLLQEYLQKDILCVTYLSMLDYDNYCDMACKYLDKIKECGRLKFELSKQCEFLKNKPPNLSS
ncbi:hypothetical protein Tco_1267044 [Tanacetum coccineum]